MVRSRRYQALLSIALLVGSREVTGTQGGYDSSLVLSMPAIPRDSIGILYQGLSRWVLSNEAQMTVDQAAPAREDLYLVIGSILQYTAHETGRPYVTESSVLAGIYDLGTRLGVFGAGLVSRAMAPAKADSFLPPLLPDAPFSLQYTAPMFELASTSGWTIRYPQYYTLWQVGQGNEPDGSRPQMAILSTLHGLHADSVGRSQATIMVIFSELEESAAFRAKWLERTGLGDAEPCSGPLAPTDWVCNVHMPANIRVLGGGWGSEKGSYFVSYSGVTGTYEANWKHFVDFMDQFQY